MIDQNQETAVAIFKTTEGYFLLLNHEDKVFTIRGWKSVNEALSYFELAFERAHNRGYEPSMSACINFIQFQPRVVTFAGLQDMIQKLGLTPNEKPYRLHSISGSYDVLPLKAELAAVVYETGKTPDLRGVK